MNLGYKEIVDILVSLKEDVMCGVNEYPNVGICNIIECKASSNIYTVWVNTCDEAVKSWDKFSGNHLYPVPSPDKDKLPGECYLYVENKWDGEYGKLRMELLDHLIEWYSTLTDEEDEHD